MAQILTAPRKSIILIYKHYLEIPHNWRRHRHEQHLLLSGTIHANMNFLLQFTQCFITLLPNHNVYREVKDQVHYAVDHS